MITQLIIREHNRQAHYDIQRDLLKKKNGLFTFIIKVCAGSITDYVLLESDNYEKTKPKTTS